MGLFSKLFKKEKITKIKKVMIKVAILTAAPPNE